MELARIALLCSVPFGALFFSGCATVTRGTSEQITIQSEPSGASVRLSNGFTGVTPATFTVPRKGSIIVTVSKESYEPVEVTLEAKLSGAGTTGFVGNALIGGLIGGGIDIATGATLSHTPNPLKITLQTKPAPIAANQPVGGMADSPPSAQVGTAAQAGLEVQAKPITARGPQPVITTAPKSGTDAVPQPAVPAETTAARPVEATDAPGASDSLGK